MEELWTGRHVDVPGHFHVRSADNFDFEINLNRCVGEQWVLNKDPLVALPIEQCISDSRWGLPTTTPALLLFYKATAYFGVKAVKPRPHDEMDFLALLPQLADEKRRWLHNAIASVHPTHPVLRVVSM